MGNSEDASNNVAEMAMSLKVRGSIGIFIWHDNFSYSVITSFLCQTLVVYLQWTIISLESKPVPPQEKARKFGKRKSEENINAETYIMGSSDQPSKKKSKKQKS